MFLSLDDALALAPEVYDDYWGQIDALVRAYPLEQQVHLWAEFAKRLGATHSKGHPFFRLGVLKLLIDTDEHEGIGFLERAYEEDERFGPSSQKQPHRMGAYRLLSLVKEYFAYLRQKDGNNWEANLAKGGSRRDLIETLFGVYDDSLLHPLDASTPTLPVFKALTGDRKLCAFAYENYYCAKRLILAYHTEGQVISHDQEEYPLARAVVGLIGGVLEAVMIARLPRVQKPTLGALLAEAHSERGLPLGPRLSILSSLIMYLRNHVHADRDSKREYFVDISTAKGCMAALDAALSELLSKSKGAN